MDQEHLDKLEQLEHDFDHALPEEVTRDVAYYRTILSNIIMIGGAPNEDWILIDTGLRRYKERILHACEERYGNKPPTAIILTHGHFDHTGSAKKLAEHWNVPIYIHEKEMDYVTGKKAYPPGDPTVGGGLVSLLSTLFPTKPEHLEGVVTALPDDGTLPHLKEWRYIETPGHTPGHISLFRESDRFLIAGGDAISTEKPESTWAMFFPIQHVYGPPAYFTQDWMAADKSVKTLAELEPDFVIAGHGLPMQGGFMKEELKKLADGFIDNAIPKHKRQ
ncbi:metallo-beta-lactamase family protein [Gracilibacillus boraciitolerans JCM 21714]|uniref:Metallo-beta-lactamase family protein n=1 Tax=Gracilibacillus boraciitolerans JCM 21714 TaxID=1298598 RepID=W4VQD1_9BACI|nr:MBL fold metallo-hydrolase [Gracilibacillus boraciitolerans]GAE94954.1 metallo-beta-lactamase family protein [Gracilibacillus boraciitolerans JCM 21714]